MIKIKKRNLVPPGGWKFKDPDSGFWLEGRSIEQLVSNVILSRKKNGYTGSFDIEETEQEVLKQICSIIGEPHCKSDEEIVIYEDKTGIFKLDKITSIASAALEMAKGESLVDAKELARRQAICNKCFLNRPARGCACATVYKMINAAIPDNRRDENLEMCGACGCMINAKIQLPMSAVNAANKGSNNKYPSYCWQLDEQSELDESKEIETPTEVKEVVEPIEEEKPKPVVKKKVKAKKKVAKKKAE